MGRIDVRGLGLVFPLTGAGAPSSGDDAALPGANGDPRLVRGPRGRVVGVRALGGIDFCLRSGDRLGLVGRNGSGKTTLLHVLAGIYPPDEGRVEIEGRVTSLLNINLGVQLNASGHRNVTLRGLAAGRSRAEIEAKRAEIAAFAGLGEFMDLPMSSYSAGMRMRLTFAIATAFTPDILLLDEWISAGDKGFQASAADRMNAFAAKAGIMVLASHSAALIERTCNQVLWLDRGHVRLHGPPDEVLAAFAEATGAKRARRRSREKRGGARRPSAA